MASSPEIKLRFSEGCPDCGTREAFLPAPLPNAGDDFDFRARDYDGFRLFMLEELAARFPERKRWTPADIEVVLVEVLAAVLDQLADMQDRIAAEAFLESARRPENVRQLLNFIGYDAMLVAKSKGEFKAPAQGSELAAFDKYWLANPHAMADAKRAGPREIHQQKRMVTVEDYALRSREHPLVALAHAWKDWSGTWFTVQLAVVCHNEFKLDEPRNPEDYDETLKTEIERFHIVSGLPVPPFSQLPPPTVRSILRPYIEAYRMAGQEVIIHDPKYVGITMALSVQISEQFFQSEIRMAISQALGQGPDGFFAPGKHGFGEDLYLSDVVEVLMNIDGIEQVCLNRFKRVGSQFRDRVRIGFIALNGLEVARCDNQPGNAAMGYYRLKIHGGRKG